MACQTAHHTHAEPPRRAAAFSVGGAGAGSLSRNGSIGGTVASSGASSGSFSPSAAGAGKARGGVFGRGSGGGCALDDTVVLEAIEALLSGISPECLGAAGWMERCERAGGQ